MPDAAPRSSTLRVDAIVVAAGSSRRMNGVDKLAALVGGRPLLAWTLAAFEAAAVVERIVLVAAPASVEPLRQAGWLPPKVVGVVAGEAWRQESVAAGFAALEALDGPSGVEQAERVVLVHDGARPAVSPRLIGAVAEAAARHGAAIPVVPIAETLKRVDAGLVTATIDRTAVGTAQTPQGVRRGLLRTAYAALPAGSRRELTDEAALLEACRIPVHAVPGEPGNLKVTVPDDLTRAAELLAVPGLRFGLGSDRHAFGPDRPLVLGGIEIADAPRLHGHSDGDVVLHAVADALLGAAGLGDLGRLFPADRRTPRGIASRDLLAAVVARLAAAGLRPASVDITVVAGRPRLAARLDQMRTSIASLLGLTIATVNVKASTGNLGGDEGAGRAISADAIAAVEPIR